MTRGSSAALSFAAVLLVACEGPPLGRPCADATGCALGNLCVEGLCVTPPGPPTLALGPDAGTPTSLASVPLLGQAPGAAWAVLFDGASELARVEVVAGAYQASLPLAEGSHALSARSEVAAGIRSGASAALVVRVDRTAPPAPVVTVAAFTTASVLTNARPVPFAGQAEAGSTVRVAVGGGATATVGADQAGGWQLALTLAEGTWAVDVTAQDAAGNTSPPTHRDVTVDTVPPQVLTRYPAPGTTDFDVRQPIRVTFSKPVQLGVGQPHLTSTLGGEVTVQPTFRDARTLDLVPVARVNPDGLSVSLPADLHDTAGNQLGAQGSWIFTAPAWLPVGGAGPVATDPTHNASLWYLYSRTELAPPAHVVPDGRRRGGLAMGTGDTPFLASVETATGDASRASLETGPLVVRQLDGGAWQALAVSPCTACLEATLAVDGTSPVVAYTETSAGRAALRVKRWSGTAWVALGAELNASPSHDAYGLGLALGPGGRPLVGWYETYLDPDLGYEVLAAHLGDWSGTAWTVERVSSTVDADESNGAGSVAVAADATALYVAVLELISLPNVVVYTRDSVGWTVVGGGPEPGSGGGSIQSQPSLALDRGLPVLGYLEKQGCFSCQAVALGDFLDRGFWVGKNVAFNRDPVQYADVPFVGVLAPGSYLGAWQEGPSNAFRSYAGTWGPTATRSTILGGAQPELRVASSAWGPLVALDGHGVPLVAHAELAAATGPARVYVRRYNAVSLP